MTIIETGSPVLELLPELLLISPLFLSNLTTRAYTSGVGLAALLNALLSKFIPGGISELAIFYVIENLVCSRFKIR